MSRTRGGATISLCVVAFLVAKQNAAFSEDEIPPSNDS